MPTNDPTIGFSNKWYPEGYKNAIWHTLDDRSAIRILSAPYFLATKLEAFKSRGNSDGRMSHDFEDIVYILENRQEIWQEIRLTPVALKAYLRSEFRHLLSNTHIMEWIECHIERGVATAAYDIHQNLIELMKE